MRSPHASLAIPQSQTRARTRSRARVLFLVLAVTAVVSLVEAYRAWQTVSDVRDARAMLESGQVLLETKRLDATSGDLASARADFSVAGDRFAAARSRLDNDPFLMVARHLPFASSQVRAASSLAAIGEDAAVIGVRGVDAASAFDDARSEGTGTLPERSLGILETVDPYIDDIESRLVQVDAERASLAGESLLPPMRSALTELDVHRRRLQEFLVTYDRARAFTPEFLGFDGPRTYLILAQNNAEMLPSGGLVSVAGTMTLNEGSIENMEFRDAVQFGEEWMAATGAYVEPPKPLRQYLLKDTSWNMLVSTWAPDFPASAQSAARFYELGGGGKVDGVIAINVTTLERLLEVTGPVYVPEFDVTVSASNAFDLIEERTRVAYEPQADRKADRKAFTGVLADEVLRRVLHPEQGQWSPLVDVLQRLGDEGDMLVYTFDAPQQELIREWGWDGGVTYGGSGDHLMVSDASLNSTKLNWVIEHSAGIDVHLDADGSARTTVALDYFNNLAPWEEGRDPELVQKLMVGGLYGGYVRLLTPPGSEILSVRDESGEIGVEEIADENGLAVFGRFFSLPRDTSKKLMFVYRTPPVAMVDEAGITYALNLQRQPGWQYDDVTLSITPPDGYGDGEFMIDGKPYMPGADEMYIDLSRDRVITARFERDDR